MGAVIAFADITERKKFEEELARNAFHDALTGLANRRLFLDHLEHAFVRVGDVHVHANVVLARNHLGWPARSPRDLRVIERVDHLFPLECPRLGHGSLPQP